MHAMHTRFHKMKPPHRHVTMSIIRTPVPPRLPLNAHHSVGKGFMQSSKSENSNSRQEDTHCHCHPAQCKVTLLCVCPLLPWSLPASPLASFARPCHRHLAVVLVRSTSSPWSPICPCPPSLPPSPSIPLPSDARSLAPSGTPVTMIMDPMSGGGLR